MNIIQGFTIISQYVNNTPGATSPIGELSTWSRTYSKEKGEYTDSTVQGYRLVTFTSVDAVTGQQLTVSANQAREILEICRDAISYATSNIRPYDPVDFRNTLQSNFFGRVADLDIGAFIDNGSMAAPEWISWTSLANGNNEVKVWLADASFADQYSYYDITVIPPLEPVDVLMGAYQDVVDQLALVTVAALGDKIQAKKDVHPETYVRILSFDLFNRNNPAQKVLTHWPVLIYGKSGDNIDAIKDAIVEYVIANSAVDRSIWEEMIPDLFKRTEFVIVPRWDQESIPNLTNLAGLYSSFLQPNECISYAADVVNFYTQSWVAANTWFMPHPYKSVLLLTVNGENNVPAKADLKTLYPDYIPVPSTSPDFSRMQLATREWILFLDDLIIQAETATKVSSLPSHMRRTIRNDMLFISAMFESVNYLVYARSNPAPI